MPVVTASILNELRRKYDIGMKDALLGYEDKAKEVSTTIKSSNKSNVYGWMNDFPQLEKWTTGNQLPKGSTKEADWEVINDRYGNGMTISVDQIQDDRLGLISDMLMRGKLQGQELARFKEQSIFDLLKNGDSSLCYDGQNFFDIDHPVNASADGTGANTSTANLFGTAGATPAWYLLDTSKAIKPLIYQERLKPEVKLVTAIENQQVLEYDEYTIRVKWRGAFSYAFWQHSAKSYEALTSINFDKVRKAMMSFKADGGRPLGVMPNILVVPPALSADAKKLIEVPYGANGESNIWFNSVKVLETPYLT